MSRTLRLDQELLLLALHDRKGTHAFGQMVVFGLAGGIFTELLNRGHLRIALGAGQRGNDLVEVVDTTAPREPLLADAVESVSESRQASPKDAVRAIAHLSDLRHRVARELCHLGILREDEDRILLLFRRRVYPTIDPAPERELVGRVRPALEGVEDPDERTATLIVLADATGTLHAVATRKELKGFKERIEEIKAGSVGGAAAREAVEAAYTAIAAVMAATTAASVATSASC